VQNNIIIINGPNINLLGDRDKSIYGSETYEELINRCNLEAEKIKINIDFYQSNIEGELVTKIQESRKSYDGMIINAAAFTHTSVAIRDALSLFKKPCIELHISNIHKREEFRQISLISDVVTGIVCGLGTSGYILAINSVYEMIQNGNK
jgi:3-dehydroquinate dehydratase-2|tara:strand:+ start:19 stop:468 length:450 start_codon:yes stop_codon:yes gene_type:complete